MKASLQMRSTRLANGQEALLAFVVAENGALGWGISFELDATAARHMAERHAGFGEERPDYSSAPA